MQKHLCPPDRAFILVYASAQSLNGGRIEARCTNKPI